MFRFTIRELVLVTVIAGLATGWWIDHRQLELSRATAQAKSEALEARDADWRELTSWLTSALEKPTSGFGIPGNQQDRESPVGNGR